jgi:hypothetical protein
MFLDTIQYHYRHVYEFKHKTIYDMTSCKMINFQNKQKDIYGNLEAYYAPASNEDEIYSQLKSCGTNNIPHVQIRSAQHAS